MKVKLMMAFILASVSGICQEFRWYENTADRIETDMEEEVQMRVEHLKVNKFNLNNADESLLSSTGVLTPIQIYSILNHIQLCGKIINVLELQVIPHMDNESVMQLLPFINIAENQYTNIRASEVLFGGDYQFYSRYQRKFPLSYAFRDTSGGYSGSPFKWTGKFAYRFKNLFRYGFQMEKDEGEWIMGDFTSAYVSVNDFSVMKSIIAGDFDVNLGQGLICWTGFGFGKGGNPELIKKISEPIRVYNSSDENIFFRGAAAHMKINRLDAAIFISQNKLDGNIIEFDTATNSILAVSSLPNSGNHRSENEIYDKNRVKQFSFGGRAGVDFSRGHVYYNILSSSLNVPVKTNNPGLNEWDGSRKFWHSLDYHYQIMNIHFFGETAYGGSIALLNGLLAPLSKNYSVSLLHRYYSGLYSAFYSSSFSENSTTENEHGIFLGQVYMPHHTLRVQASFDYYYHPQPKFRKNAPSDGYDLRFDISYSPSKKRSISVGYKYGSSEDNTDGSEKTDILERFSSHGINFYSSVKFNRVIEIRSRLGFSIYEKLDKRKGVFFAQDILIKPFSFPLSFVARFGIFDTDDSNSRIYTYENDVLYAFSVPAFIGEGYRFYIVLKGKLYRNCDLWIRYALTSFPGSESISTTSSRTSQSNPNRIESDKISELKLQLRLKF